MILDRVMPYLGPIVLLCNVTTVFFCLKPKRSMRFTVCMLAAWILTVHIFTLIVPDINPLIIRPIGIVWIPVMMFVFKDQPLQIAFAMLLSYQLGALTTHLADALVGITIGYQSPDATVMYVILSLIFLAAYMAFVLRNGRRLFERIFVDDKRGHWALYTLGALFSFAFIILMDWTAIGADMYFAMLLFILWGIGVLCYTIISVHEKTAQVQHSEALQLQMNAMRLQNEAEQKHREDMEAMRHKMLDEMAVIVELHRAGKSDEAEAMFADWQNTLQNSTSSDLCAEPILNAVFTRFARRAEEKNINLYVDSNIPGDFPVDTIKLSVMASNALENALQATDEIQERDKRVIRVKLKENDGQVGLEVVNPCDSPVEFDNKGLPVTRETGHGIGVRSIAAFANENDYLLLFSNEDNKFIMRLIMECS